MNKLVKGNLIRGLPSKLFENDQTCVACQKGKQHRASSTKDETSGILNTFITGIENLIDHKVKVIRCDNRTEFKNSDMNQFCMMKGILRRAEAVNTACYAQNRVLLVEPHNKTSYELFHSRTPTLSFMKPFGCPVTILNTNDYLGKFDGKADEVLDTLLLNCIPLGTQSNGFAGCADPPYSQDLKISHDDGSKPSSDDGKKDDEDPNKEISDDLEDPYFPDRVYKVEKSLYELHQDPRAWYETLSTYLLDNGFQRGKNDKTLFIKRHKGDILLPSKVMWMTSFSCSTKKELCIAFEKLMHEKFQMSSMGELTFFLGLQVKQKKDVIFISQDKYVEFFLKKFGFTEVKTASTPMET
ncbi:uncharacterized mitochondrial protein-like protein [Tanacetum coccineum]